MNKSVFHRYSRIFSYFFSSINFSPCHKNSLKTSARNLISLILRPRNVVLLPALKLSMLHETERRTLFVKKEPVNLAYLIKQADELHDANEGHELLTFLLKHQDSEEDEVLWRLARALCERAWGKGDDRVRKCLMMKAVEFSHRAIEKNPNNYACHKWHAIILEHLGEFQGTTERLTQAFEIRKHFTKAIELNDKDPNLFHLMGFWCFAYADMSWYERKLSSIIFTNPPQSSFQEALEYFMKAEKIQQRLSSKNYLMIAKTHLKLKNKKKAKKYLLKTMNSIIKNEEDKLANQEAVGLMKENKLDEI